MTLALLPLALALNAGDIPEAERQQRLAPHFSPRPGQSVTLNAREVRDHTRGPKAVNPNHLRGQIEVSPPAGQCFTVQRRMDRPDDVVCKKTKLSFTLGDIDRAGRIAWRITTGAGDFGTPLHWPTPYRVAIVTPFDRHPEEPPVYRYLVSCTASRTSHGGRLKVGLIGGETWTIALSEEERLAPQPPPLPNLHLHTGGSKVSVKDAASTNKPEGQPTDDAGHGEGKPKEDAPKKEAPKSADEAPDQDADRLLWSIPARDSYETGGAAFMPYGSVPPGGVGRCRYSYTGSVDDPMTGRLECHEVDGFRHVLLPLTCLGDLRKGR